MTDTGSSVSVSDTAVPEGFPYDEEEVQDLADSLRPLQYFFGVDVRGEEAAYRTAKDLLQVLCDLGYEELQLSEEAKDKLDEKRDPEAGTKAAEKALKEAEAAAAPPKSSSSTVTSKSSTTGSSS